MRGIRQIDTDLATIAKQLLERGHVFRRRDDQNVADTANLTAFPALADGAVSVGERARSYLDVNCANCHQLGGPTQSSLDLRFSTADGSINAIGTVPQFGDLGIAGARLILAGDKDRSVLWQRLNRRGAEQMPPLGSHVVDADGVDLIGEWIDSL